MSSARRVARLAGLRAVGRLLATAEATGRHRGHPAPPAGSGLRVLIVRPDHLGDTLLAAPSGRLLAAALPDAQVDWLVGPWSAEIVRRSGHRGEILTCEFPGFTRRPKRSPIEPYVMLAREAGRLRRRRYDAALVLRPDHWWGALLVAAAGIPRRFGFDVAECAPFLTDALLPPSGHALLASQDLARLAGTRLGGRPLHDGEPLSPRFEVTEEERRRARAIVGCEGPAPLVAIHPGSGAPTKNWPSARWSEVVDGLQARLGARVILTGGPDEQQLVAEVADGVRSSRPVLAGPTTLGELAALFDACDLVMGGDSGPLHLAAAVGTPTVRLYGPTSIGIFGPWPASEAQRVLQASLPCQPCDNFAAPPCGAVGTPACLHALTVEAVLDAATAVLCHPAAGRTPLVVSATSRSPSLLEGEGAVG